MDNVMDLSAFQLVDSMNDMNMLQLPNEQQRQKQQQYKPSNQQQSSRQLYQSIQDDTDLLLSLSNTSSYLSCNKSSSSPSYRSISSLSQSECYNNQQEDIFTPLISPAITPSFSYRVQQHKDVDFPPLSSPAMMPQGDFQRKLQKNQMVDPDNTNYECLSANQIRDQYEQLERAKMLITQKLTELQKTKVQQQPQKIILTTNSKPSTPSQSPHIEPATPASLMNMNTVSSPSKLQFSSSTSSKSVFQPLTYSPTAPSKSIPIPSPLALQPRKEKSVSSKKPRRDIMDKGMHGSPRALKPLLISPTLNPGKPLQLDVEHILATRSNYQNLMEGKGAALGIAFDTQIKSGIEVRRTAHKVAEQKRRDSLKEWFDRLRREVEEGYVKRHKLSEVMEAQELEKEDEETSADGSIKPLSKVLLLQYAYEYITSLKSTLDRREETIQKLLESKGNPLKRKQSEDYEGSGDEHQEQI